MKELILVAGMPDAVVERARAVPGAEVVAVDRVTADAPRLADVVAVAGHLPGDLVARMPRLRWVHSWAAGPDADLVPELVAHPAEFTSSAGNGAIPLAEQAMLLMLQLNRDERRWARAQAERRWERFTHGELAGLTLGLYGVGNAGRDLAAKAAAFHMTVIGCRASDAPVPHVERMYRPDELHEFLAPCDVVVVTAPLTDRTRGVFDAAAFAAMKPTALWICVSRGGIADDEALLEALRTGAIAGAGIDAHGVEPLPEGSPFWDAPNTIVTPHNGATTAATAARGVEIFLGNLRRFVAGDTLHNVVDKAAGY
jgi:phosphoglycerate dehydrogenase-like enzyme